jgi:hypothetical protein
VAITADTTDGRLRSWVRTVGFISRGRSLNGDRDDNRSATKLWFDRGRREPQLFRCWFLERLLGIVVDDNSNATPVRVVVVYIFYSLIDNG